ncbi:ubiquinone biosynthesis protein UbiH [Formicincola oecophyllae]|uniref:Ubiquinone biosynthesis protein UbiH n=1 Tax=Formicincola oecophyllae TaxID=2558361 RepID=A0A4Y6UDA8_9PROT|nr:ubiquinone biosynthesis protein UbiH [Formicincola oecophyllae]
MAARSGAQQSSGGAFDVCINGAGPIGATIACLLARKGLRVAVVERNALPRAPRPELDGRAYALAEGVIPLLAESGIWTRLPRQAEPITTIDIIDSAGRPVADGLPGGLLGRALRQNLDKVTFTPGDAPEGHPFGWMVEAYDLLPAITHALEAARPAQPGAAGVTVFEQTEADFAFSPEGVTISLSPAGQEGYGQESARTITAPLAIACDGRRSALREAAGIPLTVLPYGKHALVVPLVHERPHHGSALEHFLPEGPFARLPLPPGPGGEFRSALVWTDTPERIHHLATLPAEAFLRQAQKRLGDRSLGALKLAGKRWRYPLTSQYAHRYKAERLLLAGDAAHGLHPVAGQGMNLGFRDVRLIVRLLGEAFSQGADLGSPELLARYQRQARPEDFAMLVGCDVMERLFSSRNPVAITARRLGMNVMARLPPLRRRFIAQAMGY